MSSGTGPKDTSKPAPIAADSVAPNASTERLNTKAAGVIGLAVMCSRVLGLARDQLFAALFGVSGMDMMARRVLRVPSSFPWIRRRSPSPAAFTT